jgi:hypothetical protein
MWKVEYCKVLTQNCKLKEISVMASDHMVIFRTRECTTSSESELMKLMFKTDENHEVLVADMYNMFCRVVYFVSKYSF